MRIYFEETAMLTVNKAVAHPWKCDVMGHLTTRFYVGMFDDASYHFLFTVFGWAGATDESGETGWVDVRHVTEYLAEVAAGDILEIRASLVKIGTKSLTARYEMINLGKGEVAATLESIYVLFDMKARTGQVISDQLREMASNYLEQQAAH
jgi:acyl-CoA thioester hydrolase